MVLALSFPGLAAGSAKAEGMADHGGGTFHAVRLETAVADGRVGWDLDGWVGGDTHKLWLKSEGDGDGGEVWAMYSRKVSSFWDVQGGARVESGHSYVVAGVNGVAPYFVETEAHVFVRDDGAVSGRVRLEEQWLLTNRLIVRPRIEVNVNGRDDAKAGLGSGLSDVQAGLQTRYEMTRGFAPYVEVRWQKRFGGTADYARLRGERAEARRVEAGISWLF